MKHNFVFTFNRYLFYSKTRVNNEIAFQLISDTDFLKTLKNILLDCDDSQIITLRTIFVEGVDPATVKTCL
jgi:hypothetical protein